jgi:uncharacterized protein
MHTVQCPNCKKKVIWSKESPFRPFCSERCRTIDLGAWADGSYAIPISSSNDDSSDDLELNEDLELNDDFESNDTDSNDDSKSNND